MVVDLLEKTRVNIKDMTVDKPEKSRVLHFDAERDITPSDWQGITQQLQEINRLTEKAYNYTRTAVEVKLLAPKLYADTVQNPEILWQGLTKQWRTDRKKAGPERFFFFTGILWEMQVLFPERINKLYPDASEWEKDYGKIIGSLKTDRENGSLYTKIAGDVPTLNYAAYFDVVTKGRISKDLDLANDWDIINQRLNRFRQELKMGRNPHWSLLPNELATIRILLPQHFSEIDITEDEWSEMKNQLEPMRQLVHTEENRWENFVRLATDLQIAAAEKVERTDQGLVIHPRVPQPLNEQPASLPQTRRF